MASLLSLSNELLLLIGSSLGVRDLRSLIQTNQFLACVLTEDFNRFALQRNYRITALYWAAATGNEALVRLLVERGGGLLVKDSDVSLSVIFLETACNGKEDICKRLLKNGSQLIVQESYQKYTPLHWTLRNGYNVMFRSLLDIGADADIQDIYGRTTLHEATIRNNVPAVRLLIERGAYLDAGDTFMTTPLHEAAGRGHIDAVQLLLENGADPNVQKTNGSTPLHNPIYSIESELCIAWLLIKHGANVNIRDDEENTAIDMVLFGEDITLTDMVYPSAQKPMPPCRFMLEKAEPNFLTNYRRATTLHLAAKMGELELVKALLDGGTDVSERDNNR